MFCTLLLSESCVAQVVDHYWSYSLDNCEGGTSELRIATKEAMCDTLAQREIDVRVCRDDPASHPDLTYSWEPIEHWILERPVPSPSGCFTRFRENRHFGPPFNTSQSYEIYIDGGGAGISMYPIIVPMYVSANPDNAANCGPSCNRVGHPINPAGGAVYDTIVDVASGNDSFGFSRFYNSMDPGTATLGRGWRHSFSRSVQARGLGWPRVPYIQNTVNSSLYNSPEAACGAGFQEIKSRVPQWANAVAEYIDRVCILKVGTITIGTLTILYDSTTPAPEMAEIAAYEVIRDDGQVVRFTGSTGSLIAPPGSKLKLQKLSGGFVLMDEKDSVESYDSNGKLLTITTRAGGVQTMGYDAAGRLNTVIDNFGRQVSLTYDTQNRLSSVTRQ